MISAASCYEHTRKQKEIVVPFSNKVLAQRIQSSDTDLMQLDLNIADIKD